MIERKNRPSDVDGAATLAGIAAGTYAAVVSTCVAAELKRDGIIKRLVAGEYPAALEARRAYEAAHPVPGATTYPPAGDREMAEKVAEWMRNRRAATHIAVGSHCDATMHLPDPTRRPLAAFCSLSGPAKVAVGAIVLATGLAGVKLAYALLGPGGEGEGQASPARR